MLIRLLAWLQEPIETRNFAENCLFLIINLVGFNVPAPICFKYQL